AGLDEAVAGAEFIVEAVREDLGIKQQLFADIERAARPDAVFASNTSVIPITTIMGGLQNRARALGTHWWNPPFWGALCGGVGTERALASRDRFGNDPARRSRQDAGAREERRAGLRRQPPAACTVARGDLAGGERHLRC